MHIDYDPKTKTVHMDLVDLEHCGFDHDDFNWELNVAGIDDEEARWPDTLVVRFREGAVRVRKEQEASDDS